MRLSPLPKAASNAPPGYPLFAAHAVKPNGSSKSTAPTSDFRVGGEVGSFYLEFTHKTVPWPIRVRIMPGGGHYCVKQTLSQLFEIEYDPQKGFHFGGVIGGYCHYRSSCGAAAAGVGEGEGACSSNDVPEQSEAAW